MVPDHFDTVDPGRHWRPLVVGTADELLLELTTLVARRLEEPGSYAIVCSGRNRFVQVAVDVHGELRAETVSNEFLDADERLSVAEEAHLLSLGWLPPDDERPNWWRDFDPAPWPAPLVAALCGRTLLDVHLPRQASTAPVLRVGIGHFDYERT